MNKWVFVLCAKLPIIYEAATFHLGSKKTAMRNICYCAKNCDSTSSYYSILFCYDFNVSSPQWKSKMY